MMRREKERRIAPSMSKHARNLRRPLTPAEKAIWDRVRDSQLGIPIRRQHVIGNRFIADFCCTRAKVCIEIDGDIHAVPGQEEQDATRTEWIEARGYRVVRFTNDEVMQNLPAVLEAIREVCLQGMHGKPTPKGG